MTGIEQADHADTEPRADPSAADPPRDRTRHDRLVSHATPGPGNAMAEWTDAKHPLRVGYNYALVWLARTAPSLRLRRWCLRRMGATVERGVGWGLEATADVFWPEKITLREDAIVGYDATILCHEFLQDEYRTGAVEVGERAMIGAGAIVLPGVRIGPDASVAANSLVTRDVPPGATVAGVPATTMGEDDDEAMTMGEDDDEAMTMGDDDDEAMTTREDDDEAKTPNAQRDSPSEPDPSEETASSREP